MTTMNNVPATATTTGVALPGALNLPAEYVTSFTDNTASGLPFIKTTANGFNVEFPGMGKVTLPTIQGFLMATHPARTGRQWWAQQYVPGQSHNPPDCFSVDSETPSANAKTPQAATCKECPYNPQGVNRCSFIKTFVMGVLGTDPGTGLVTVTPMAVKLSSPSLFANVVLQEGYYSWFDYRSYMRARGKQGYQLITELSAVQIPSVAGNDQNTAVVFRHIGDMTQEHEASISAAFSDAADSIRLVIEPQYNYEEEAPAGQAQAAPVNQAQAATVTPAGQAQAAPVNQAQAATVNPAGQAQAAPVNQAQAAPVNQAQAATVNPAGQAQAAPVNPAGAATTSAFAVDPAVQAALAQAAGIASAS